MQSKLVEWGATALLLSLVPACHSNNDDDDGGGGGGGGAGLAPTVMSTSPAPAATGVPVNASVEADFSEPMDADTLTTTTFTLTFGAAEVPVDGTVLYTDSTAVFWPDEHLSDFGTYNATVTTDARDPSGQGLVENHVWSFDTGNVMQATPPVALGGADTFAILSKAGISTVPASVITGNIGVSPIFATAITMFSLTMDASGEFATASQVTGNVYAADYTAPTPDNLRLAVLDMQAAFEDAAARAPDVTEFLAGNFVTAQVLPPGVYKWGTGLSIGANVSLPGSVTDVWIFQIAQNLTVASGITVLTTGAALPENVFWQVSGLVDLDTTVQLDGIVLSATSITLRTGATVDGRLLAQTRVNLDHATVTEQ